MSRSVFAVVATVGFGWLLGSAQVDAQEAVLEQIYGRGVHAYFSQDYQTAHQRFTMAIENGAEDPRVYYFRGLTYMNLGRPEQAEGDFEKGAKLETKDLDRSYNVAKALERVQGAVRLDLEQHRVKARMASLERQQTIRRARYDELRGQEREFSEEQNAPDAATD